MMKLILEIEPMSNINYGATGVEAIKQNVAFIMATYQQSCPLDREFGYVPVLDSPLNKLSRQRNTAALIQAIHEFEPRVEVLEVTYEETAEELLKGKLKPKAKVVLADEQI